MKRKIIIILITMGFCAIFIQQAYAFWIWTPESGKFENPKYATKQNPKLQFEYAMEFFNDGQSERAIREFKQLIKNFPKAHEAAEAQYYIGRSLQQRVENDVKQQEETCQANSKPGCKAQEKLWYRAKYYQAYKAYQLVIDKYAFTARFDEVIELEYEIAEWFISESKKRILGMTFELEDPVIEILERIVENAPYGKIAPKTQYRLGIYLKSKSYYVQARKELEKLVNNYPESEWLEAAKYQIASCIAEISPKPDYDQHLTMEAREKFQDFAKAHPEAELSKDAQKQIGHLREKEAQSNFEIASFYERQKSLESAKIYYKYVIDNYSDSVWAAEAKEALKRLETKE